MCIGSWPGLCLRMIFPGTPEVVTVRCTAGQVFPTPGRAANGIEVRFVAGHGDAPGDVPARLRQGIVQLAAYLFENRGDALAGAAIDASGAAVLWRPLIVARL